jgi:hypothetical protein
VPSPAVPELGVQLLEFVERPLEFVSIVGRLPVYTVATVCVWSFSTQYGVHKRLSVFVDVLLEPEFVA